MRESKAFDEAAEVYFLFSFLHRHRKFRTCAFLHLPRNVHDWQYGIATESGMMSYLLPGHNYVRNFIFSCMCVCMDVYVYVLYIN